MHKGEVTSADLSPFPPHYLPNTTPPSTMTETHLFSGAHNFIVNGGTFNARGALSGFVDNFVYTFDR